MNNIKVLSAAIFLILAKSALGIEVERNNDSKTANPLGLENVGQLSRGSDVDFFSIDNSCIKYTADDAKLDISGNIKAGNCATYTAADELAIPGNIEGEDKYRSEISLAFSCNSRATAGQGGWYLGIHDSRGVLQATYQVNPADCMTGATGLAGPYSFTFPSSRDVPSYYLSVVADCHLPIYNASNDPLKPVISANIFVQSTPAKQTDIDAAQAEIVKAKKVLAAATTALNDATFSVIGSNDSIAKANDAILMAKDIADQSQPDLTAATSIYAVSSTAKAVGIMSNAMGYSIQSHALFIDADKAAKNPAVQKAIEDAGLEITRLEAEVKNATDANDAAKSISDLVANNLDNATVNAKTAQTTSDTAEATFDTAQATLDTIQATLTTAKATFTNATTTFTTAKSSFDKAIGSDNVNKALTLFNKADRDLNTAKTDVTKAQADFDNAKKDIIKPTTDFTKAQAASNTARLAQTAAQKIVDDNPTVVTNLTNTQTNLNLANTNKANADNAKKAAENNKTNLEKAQADTKSDDDDATKKLGLANTALANAVTILNATVKADIAAANAATNSGSRTNNSCAVSNHATYTIKENQDNAPIIPRIASDSVKAAVALGTDKTGQINSITDNDIYIVESGDAPEIPLVFSCSPMAARKMNDWTLDIYDDSNELVSSQVINGSDCGSGFKADKGGYKFKLLAKDSTRHYLSVNSVCTTADCVVDTSDYTIARDVVKTYTGVLATSKIITTKTANFKLTKCGSNSNATIEVNAENVNLRRKLSPINIQIGGMVCQTAAPILASSFAGAVVKPSTLSDLITKKDDVTVGLSDCGAAKGKVTLTGTGLDLENLNFDNAIDTVSIPIKVDFGDFHCSGKDTFYITTDENTGDMSYTNKLPEPIIPPPVVIPPIKTPCFHSVCAADVTNEQDFPIFGAN